MIEQCTALEWPGFLRDHWGLFTHHMQGVVLSAVLVAVFTFAEFVWSRPSFGSINGRVVNIAIGLVVGVVAFFFIVAVAQVATVMSKDGLLIALLPPIPPQGYCWSCHHCCLVRGGLGFLSILVSSRSTHICGVVAIASSAP